MRITESPEKSRLNILISGSIMGADSAQAFEDHTTKWLNSEYRHFAFNLENLIAMNSASIGRLILFHNKLKEKGRSLSIEECSPNLLTTLKLVRADSMLGLEL